ncbi:MAG: type II secretion system F family protein [bacterium]|nr:type II secretion system F family protein [bacterium]
MKFRVTIKKGGAKDEERVIEAESRFAVYDAVQKEGGSVLSITESTGLESLRHLNIAIGTGVKRQEIITMAKNLSAMLTAGLSLARALSVLERQSRNKHLREITAKISAAVTKGLTFHEALGEHPRVFSKLFIAMAKAGEESGGLADALLVVGTQMERSEELNRKIKGAMIYPAIVVGAIVVVTILMLVFVVPTLTATFTQLGVKLPLATRVIVALSNFMVNHIIVVLTLLVLVVAGIVTFARSRMGNAIILRTALFLPVVGELVRETFAARAARTLASLLASGVPVLAALSISEEVVGAPLFARVLNEASARVKKGDTLSAAFIEHPKLYPLMMSDMIAVGEETGKLADMLHQVAEFYEGDVSQKTKDLSTIIEPVLMLFIGAMVGVFAVSMIAPIYSLSSAI